MEARAALRAPRGRGDPRLYRKGGYASGGSLARARIRKAGRKEEAQTEEARPRARYVINSVMARVFVIRAAVFEGGRAHVSAGAACMCRGVVSRLGLYTSYPSRRESRFRVGTFSELRVLLWRLRIFRDNYGDDMALKFATLRCTKFLYLDL